MSLALTLASRNLFQDRLRFVATLTGIVFSVLLVIIQMGLYLGFGRMITNMIEHASADLWVVATGTKSFEGLSLLDARMARRLQAIDGVASVAPVVIGFSNWQLPDGAMVPVLVVGSDFRQHHFQPWNIVDGTIGALQSRDMVAVDKTYFHRLGISGLGAVVQIRGVPAKVAAVTEGIRSFTTTPYVFADLAYAQSYIGLHRGKVSHFIVELKKDADRSRVQKDIEAAIHGVEALTPQQFDDRSRSFWLFGTGAGTALFAGAILGVIVGTIIVAQTLYSSTKDHLYEFATLRAIGCGRTYIYQVIIYQAILNAVIGYVIAAGVSFIVGQVATNSVLPIVINIPLIGGIFLLTVIMCVVSAQAAIFRTIRIDPVMVLSR